jgi:hypothetical protein
MTFRSKFDVDLTQIVKEAKEVVFYSLPDEGGYRDEYTSFDDAAFALTTSAIYQHILPPSRVPLEELLMVKEYRDKIREVIDYLDRD